MNWRRISTVVGRALIGIIYIISGVSKIMDYAGTAQYMASEKMPMISVLEPAAIVVEIVFGLGIVLGYRARLSGLILAAYSIVATVIFNHFWNMPAGAMQATVMHLFWSTIVMVGACLFIAGMGPGTCALENLKARKPAAA
jgi:putative oxidoreductase